MRHCLGLLALLTISGCWREVPVGHVGVTTKWGAVLEGTLQSGTHTVNPMTTIIWPVDVRIHKLEVKASASSKDLQMVTSTVVLNFRIKGEKADDVFKSIGVLEDVQETIVLPTLQESVKVAMAKYTAEELITRRPNVKNDMREYMITTLAPHHVEVVSLSITEFRFSDAFSKAIEEKQVAEQAALRALNDLKRIKTEAEQAIERSKGVAAAKLTEAGAEAEAQRLLQDTLTDGIIQFRTVQQWDGKLPQVSSDATPSITLR